jgi:predicted phage terminase large subunit-like protein
MAQWLHEWYRPARFHRELGRHCDDLLAAVMAGEHPRYAFSAPPRHGKTVLVGHALPLRLFALMPGGQVFYQTSDQERAGKASRVVMRGVERLYQADPARFAHLAPTSKWAPLEWETVGGNGWVATGILSSTGGVGSHLYIPDDVTGSSARAQSKATRSRIQTAFIEDGMSRIMGGGGAALMETRRHTDDVRGYVDREHPGMFRAVDYPCVAEVEGHDWRQVGQYLWPEGGYDAQWRANMPGIQGETPVWARLYQQRPTVEGGALFRDEWVHHYRDDPHTLAASMDEVALTIDLAVKGKATSDYSVIQAWGRRGAERYLLGMWRARVGFVGMLQGIQHMAEEWPDYAFALLEDKAAGPEALEMLRARVANLIPYSPRDAKEVRAQQAALTWAAGQVRIPHPDVCPWVRDFINELLAFPDAPHDDTVDPMTQLFLWWRGSDGEGAATGYVDVSSLWADMGL